jgi:hypothetical protein
MWPAHLFIKPSSSLDYHVTHLRFEDIHRLVPGHWRQAVYFRTPLVESPHRHAFACDFVGR